ncbi:pyruvate kinase [Streptococcus suis 98HAH33]|nr:pyruvate kinase [Streptococcus suis 98HAH33]
MLIKGHMTIEINRSFVKMNIRVKIVATLGPAVEIRVGIKFGDDGYWVDKLDVESSAQKIAALITEGANVFRFNFSHGDHQEQGDRMATVASCRRNALVKK